MTTRSGSYELLRCQANKGGIEIVRVLHGARDIAGILAEQFGVEEDAGDDEGSGEAEA